VEDLGDREVQTGDPSAVFWWTAGPWSCEAVWAWEGDAQGEIAQDLVTLRANQD